MLLNSSLQLKRAKNYWRKLWRVKESLRNRISLRNCRRPFRNLKSSDGTTLSISDSSRDLLMRGNNAKRMVCNSMGFNETNLSWDLLTSSLNSWLSITKSLKSKDKSSTCRSWRTTWFITMSLETDSLSWWRSLRKRSLKNRAHKQLMTSRQPASNKGSWTCECKSRCFPCMISKLSKKSRRLCGSLTLMNCCQQARLTLSHRSTSKLMEEDLTLCRLSNGETSLTITSRFLRSCLSCAITQSSTNFSGKST